MNAMEYLEKTQDNFGQIRIITKSAKCTNIEFSPFGLIGVFIYQLPDDQIKPFVDWLMYQTTAIIHGQPFAYAVDYDRWYEMWSKEQMATVTD